MSDYMTKVWHVASGECLKTFHETPTETEVRYALFSPDSTKLFTHQNESNRLWDIESGECVTEFVTFS